MQAKTIAEMEKRGEGLHIPASPQDITRSDIMQYLANIEQEIHQGLFSQEEFSLIRHALYEKYLDREQSPFFLYHFLPLWEKAVQIIFQDNHHPRIIELGCGTGTSSLLFALLGAEVVGVDYDMDLIEICNKRKAFYESHCGPVNARFHCADVFEFDFREHEPVDIFFSLFAFNLMKPCDLLLERMVPVLQNSGKIVIMDGNSSNLYALLVPTRRRPGVLAPKEMEEILEALGCTVQVMETHCAIPPFMFRNPLEGEIALWMEKGIKAVGLHRYFGNSYTIVAEKI